MINWKTPEISDYKKIYETISNVSSSGSDISFANIFLLREKYNIKISFYDGFLLRKYEGKDSRCGFAMPLGNGDIKKVLNILREQENCRFCLLTEADKNIIECLFPNQFIFDSDRGDSDYIYKKENLQNLLGKLYVKKRNHISKYKRTYSDFYIKKINKHNISDAMLVEEQWYNSKKSDSSVIKEYNAIKEALLNFDALNLSGAILYTDEAPVGMTVASFISPSVIDIHFEKVIGDYAKYGGYSVINNLFARELPESVLLINREEDINSPGLRKAKLSYHPDIILNKYYAYEV